MAAPHLQRKLGIWACISIVAGSVIGSSIFMKPATMAAQLGSPLFLMLVWVIAGVVSIFGALINAEIGAMLPETGGQYVYFRHMYGKFFAYLYGWASFIVINTAAIAAIAFIFAQYTSYFIDLPVFDKETEQSVFLSIPFIGKIFPLQNIGVKGLAIVLIVLITAINHHSVKTGGAVQVLFTVIKIGALLFIVFALLFSGKGSVENFTTASDAIDFSGWPLLLGFVAATSGALAAFDGWNNLGLAGGEVKDPQKNIPRGLLWGLGICFVLYVLTTLSYIYILPVDEMKNSQLVATDALKIVSGNSGAAVIALLVVISTAGAVNGNVLPCARVNYAMAKDKVFFSWAGRVGAANKTPYGALWIQCIWACLFVISGSFDMLTDMFVFVTWIFYGFAAFGIFILRKKMPNAERPFKLKAYPWAPIVFVFFSVFYFVITLYNDINNYLSGKTQVIFSLLGLGLIVAGIPFYFYFKSRQNK
jgi:basic amino acid/polyamine antiporter, APA family